MARRRRGHHGAHENEERWLLTYADMITLLMALFMVLFSISSVNISKYQTLQESLHAAFSGSVLPGGTALKSSGATASNLVIPSASPTQSILPPSSASSETVPQQLAQQQVGQAVRQQTSPTSVKLPTPKGTTKLQQQEHAAQVEQNTFLQLRARLEAYAKAHGFARDVRVTIVKQGLIIQVLTDRLLFNSGSASLDPVGLPLLAEIGQLLGLVSNPVDITGYTDSVPQHSAQFPSNLWLSSGRADTVEQFLTDHGLSASRSWAIGRGALDPVASNATAAGQALNRRVVIELVRTGIVPTLHQSSKGR